jgi:hypothetical protein
LISLNGEKGFLFRKNMFFRIKKLKQKVVLGNLVFILANLVKLIKIFLRNFTNLLVCGQAVNLCNNTQGGGPDGSILMLVGQITGAVLPFKLSIKIRNFVSLKFYLLISNTKSL